MSGVPGIRASGVELMLDDPLAVEAARTIGYRGAGTIEFIAVSSYDSGSVTSGAVRLVMDVRGNIENRHVLIIEDIVDTGHTLKYLIGILESHRPASIRTAALYELALIT